MIIMADPIPYVRINDTTIKINGDTISEAAKNIHEPGWDIAYHTVHKHNGPYLRYFIINDTAHTYRWNKHDLTIIKPHPNAQHIINEFKEFMASETQ